MVQRVEVAPRAGRVRTRQSASVAMTVPAHKDYVVIIRSAVAQLGACFGYSAREITDLRLAVNEACGLLVAGRRGTGPAAAAFGSIDCRAEVRGDTLRVTVAAPAAGFGTPDTDSFGWNIMTALVDALAWAQDGLTVRVALEKRRTRPDG